MSIMPAPELRQPQGSEYIPNKDECTLAFLAELLQLFCWFVAPLIIFLAKRNSRFVRFHALQALLWQGLLAACFVIGLILIWASAVTHLVLLGSSTPSAFIPLLILLFTFGMATSFAVNLILAIAFGIFALRGEWRKYPILGGIALRVVNR